MPLSVLQARTGATTPQTLTPDSLGIVFAYINEHPQGRDVIVRHTPAVAAGANITPSGDLATVGITAGPWRLEAAGGNVVIVDIDSSLRASVISANANELQLRLSRCGLDSFTITHTTPGQPGRRAVVERVTIQVKKRIQSTAFFDMHHPSRPPRVLSLRGSYPPPAGPPDAGVPAAPVRSGRDVLRDAVTFFDINFGIDIALPAVAERILTNQTLRLTQSGNLPNQFLQQLQLLRRVTADPRTLIWVAASEVLQGQRRLCVGGNNIIAMGFQSFVDQIGQLNRLVNDYRQRTRVDTPGARAQFMAGLQPQPSADFRTALSAILNLSLTAETLGQTSLYLTLIHEMGHAFGLIPANGNNGGVSVDPNWPDPDRAHSSRRSNQGGEHCSNSQCAMWWDAESGQAFRAALISGNTPFDGLTPGSTRHTRCSLYLRTCDLSDLRPYPG